MLFVAFSGGKDSTAMALRMAEQGEKFALLHSPTGNELPDLQEHLLRVSEETGAEIVYAKNGTLASWIEKWGALPSTRMRWCTRVLKIEPCKAVLARNRGSTLCVGLRADELERKGLYGDYCDYRYPLRDWSWGIKDVVAYCAERGFSPPVRTDCAVCPYQRLGEWRWLWKNHPEHYAQGEAWEEDTGHTFRSAQRDTWPADLAGLRAEFERGRSLRGDKRHKQHTLFDDGPGPCRVCRF